MSYRYDKKSGKSDTRKIDRSLERRRNEESSTRSTAGPSGSGGKNWRERSRHRHGSTSGRQRWQSNNRKWVNPNFRQSHHHQRNNWSNRRNRPPGDTLPLEGLILLQNLAQLASLNILNSQNPDANTRNENLEDTNESISDKGDTCRSRIENDEDVDFSEDIVVEPVKRKPLISVVPFEKLRDKVAEHSNIENSTQNETPQPTAGEENPEQSTIGEILHDPSSANDQSPVRFETKDLLQDVIANEEDTLIASTSSETNREPQSSLQNETHKSNSDDVAKRTPDEVTKKLVNQVARMDKYNIRNVINNPAMKFDAALKLHGRKKLREEIRKQLKTIDLNELDKTISDHFTVDTYIDSEVLPDRALIEISKTLNINLFGDKSPPYSTEKEEESAKENNLESTELYISSETNDESDCLREIKSEIDVGTRNKTISTSDNDDVIVLSDSSKSDNDEGSTSKASSKKQTKNRRKSVHEKVVDKFKKTVLPNVPFKDRKQYEAKDNSNVSNAINNIYNMCIGKLGNSGESPKKASSKDKSRSKKSLSDEEAVQCLMDNIQNLFQKDKDLNDKQKDSSKQDKDTANMKISDEKLKSPEKPSKKRHRNDTEISPSSKKKQKSDESSRSREQDKTGPKHTLKPSTTAPENQCESPQKNKDIDKSKNHKDTRHDQRSSKSSKSETSTKKHDKEIKNSKQATTSQKSEKEKNQTNSKSSKKSNYYHNEKECKKSSKKPKSNEISTDDSMQRSRNKTSPTKSSSTPSIQERYVSTSEDISKRKKPAQSAKSIAKPSTDATTESDDGCRYSQKSNRPETEDEPTLSCDSSSNKPIDSSICRKTFSDSCTTDPDEGVNVAKTLEESNKNRISSTRERQQSQELRSCHFLDSSRTQSIQIASKDSHLDHFPSDRTNAELLPVDTVAEDTEITNQCVNGVNETSINDPSINLKLSINNCDLNRNSDSGNEGIMKSPTHSENKPRTWKSPGEKKCLVEFIASSLSSPKSSEILTRTGSSANGLHSHMSSGISDEEVISTISTHEENQGVTEGHSEDESLSSDSEVNQVSQNGLGINQMDSIRLQMLMQQNKVSDAVLNSLKEYDMKLMELQKQKMFLEEMLLKLQKEKMTVEVATIKLQTEKYLILNSILGQNHLNTPLSNIENISNTMPFLSANQISTSSHLFNGSFNMETAMAAVAAQSQLSNLETKKTRSRKAPKKKYVPKNSEFSRKLKNRKKRCQRDILIEDATKALFRDEAGEKSNLFTIPCRRSQSVASSDTSKTSPEKKQIDVTTDPASTQQIKSENISTESGYSPKDNSPHKNDNSSKKLRECKVLVEEDDDPLSQHTPSSSSCIIIDEVEHLVISDDDDDNETNSPELNETNSPELISEDTTFEISNGNLEGYKMPIICLQVVHKYLIAASEDGNIYKFNLFTHDLEAVFAKHTESVTNIKIIGNNCIYSISLDGYLKKTSVENFGLEMVSVNVQEPLQSIDLEWNTAFMGSRWGNIFTYNIKTGKLCETLLCSLGSSIMAIKATKEGPRRILIISSKGNQVNLRDANSGLLLRIINIPNETNVYSVIMSEGVIYFGTNKNEIFIFDLPSANRVASYTCGNGAVSMKLYKKNLLFVGCYDGFIYVINKSTGAQIGRFPGSGKIVLSLDIVADKLITSSRDNKMQIMDIPSYILALVKN